jgi:dihydrodiol dehydrogenase / D-xylose 1-dehydrogenase (NADP)
MNSKIYKWGIIGTGNIANNFVKGLSILPNAELYAVASRTKAKAEEFAKKYGFKNSYGSYEELAQDNNIDIIYIATPNSSHKDDAMLCIRNGKAVLCEKPFTLNAEETEEVVSLAREKKVFLMEAMWSRFFPVMNQVRKWLEEELIGEVRMINADFGFRREGPIILEDRKVNPNLGGGALLDVGVYPIAFSSMVFGADPNNITGVTSKCETGVDEQSAMLLGYEGGKISVLSCAINTNTPKEARIIGNKGFIYIPEFFKATKAVLQVNGEEQVTVEVPNKSNGYEYEAEAVMKCLEEGKLEHELMPLDESIKIIKIMDELRRQWGIIYPSEK